MTPEKHTVGTTLHELWCADFDKMVCETGENVHSTDAVAAGNLLWMQLPLEEKVESIAIARKLRWDVKLYKAFMAKTEEERVNALLRE